MSIKSPSIPVAPEISVVAEVSVLPGMSTLCPAETRRSRASDPRTIRSRQQLISAALRLLRERDVDAISITEITAAAGVSRPTFYLHYASRDELLADAVRDRLRALLPVAESVDIPTLADRVLNDRVLTDVVPLPLIDLVRTLNDDRDLFRKLMCNTTTLGQCRYEFVHHMATQFARLVDGGGSANLAGDHGEAALFLAGGTMAVLAAWTVDAVPAGEADVADLARRLWTMIRAVVSS
jgi:AcrR family transcriptional regulator